MCGDIISVFHVSEHVSLSSMHGEVSPCLPCVVTLSASPPVVVTVSPSLPCVVRVMPELAGSVSSSRVTSHHTSYRSAHSPLPAGRQHFQPAAPPHWNIPDPGGWSCHLRPGGRIHRHIPERLACQLQSKMASELLESTTCMWMIMGFGLREEFMNDFCFFM